MALFFMRNNATRSGESQFTMQEGVNCDFMQEGVNCDSPLLAYHFARAYPSNLDMNGRIVRNTTFSGNAYNMNVSEFATGIYTLKLVSDKGEIQNIRIIKK